MPANQEKLYPSMNGGKSTSKTKSLKFSQYMTLTKHLGRMNKLAIKPTQFSRLTTLRFKDPLETISNKFLASPRTSKTSSPLKRVLY
jgi:hypothetical protein